MCIARLCTRKGSSAATQSELSGEKCRGRTTEVEEKRAGVGEGGGREILVLGDCERWWSGEWTARFYKGRILKVECVDVACVKEERLEAVLRSEFCKDRDK